MVKYDPVVPNYSSKAPVEAGGKQEVKASPFGKDQPPAGTPSDALRSHKGAGKHL